MAFPRWFSREKKESELDRIKRLNNGSISYTTETAEKVSPRMAYRIFESVSVVFDAVDKISSRVASLELVMKNADREIIRDHEFLSLAGKTKTMTELATSLELCGECFLVARGRADRPALDVEVIEPYCIIDGEKSSNEEMPRVIRTDSDRDRRAYKRDDRDRYISKDGLNELIPIVKRKEMRSWRGLSKLSPLVHETIHIQRGNAHNTSLLKNGLKNSIILSPKEGDIDMEEGNKIRDALEKYHAGSNNVGKPLILPTSFALVSASSSTKDMDYISLIDVDENRIYRIYNIPLPLVKSGTMTQSNYEAAIPFLYSDAVLPAFNFLAEELNLRLIKPRHGDEFKLTYDEFSIPALARYQTDIMRTMKDTGAVTINEVRTLGGYEAVDGADDIMVSSGTVRLKDMDMDNMGYGVED